METTLLYGAAPHARLASPGFVTRCDLPYALGVVDGLVSVTQNAWGLAGFAARTLKVLQ